MPRPTHLTNTAWTPTWRGCWLSSAGTEQSSHLVNSSHVGASRCHHLLQPGGWMETIGPGNHLSAGSDPWDIPMKTRTQHQGLHPAAIQWLVWLLQHESFCSSRSNTQGLKLLRLVGRISTTEEQILHSNTWPRCSPNSSSQGLSAFKSFKWILQTSLATSVIRASSASIKTHRNDQRGSVRVWRITSFHLLQPCQLLGFSSQVTLRSCARSRNSLLFLVTLGVKSSNGRPFAFF